MSSRKYSLTDEKPLLATSDSTNLRCEAGSETLTLVFLFLVPMDGLLPSMAGIGKDWQPPRGVALPQVERTPRSATLARPETPVRKGRDARARDLRRPGN